jgi:hypothetical protein
MTMPTQIEKFWTFVLEREIIREHKEAGCPAPHTEDERLRDFHFPNIRRSDDPSTVWLHGALLRHLDRPEDIILATVLFRAFGGSVATGEAFAPVFHGSGWNEGLFLDAVGPLETPFSTRIHRHLRMGTLADVAAAGCDVRRQIGYWPLIRGASLCDATRALKRIPKMGPEMAYEVVCDLRRTIILRNAPDARTWAYPGTSAVRAAGTITDNDWRHTRRDDCLKAGLLMQDLLATSRTDFPDWEMSEIHRALTMYHFWSRKATPTRRHRWN